MTNLSSTPIDIPFRASYLKWHRANHHFDEFKAVVEAYLTSQPVTPILGETEDGMPTLEGWDMKGIPDVLSTILGDIIHNLRASLDLMASELARRNGKSDKDVYFPFAESADQLDFMIGRRNFDRAGKAAECVLREIAPYKGGNIELRAIHDLDIQDKHKALILSPGVIAELKVTWGPDETGKLVAKPSMAPLQLFMPKDSALASRECLMTLENLMEVTAGVIEAFERLTVPAGEAPILRD